MAAQCNFPFGRHFGRNEQYAASVPEVDSVSKNTHTGKVQLDSKGNAMLFDFTACDSQYENDGSVKFEKYSGNPLDPSMTRGQIRESKAALAKRTKQVLDGEQRCLWRAFKDFKTRGVFDIIGQRVSVDENGKMDKTSWQQLKAAMDIYRDKRFETFRYVFIDKNTGQIRDQLSLSTRMPHISFVDKEDGSVLSKVLKRAQDTNCFVVAAHNHPSGDIRPSDEDLKINKRIEEALTPQGETESLLKGHIILNHDTFSLYTKENGWEKCDGQKITGQLNIDPLVNEVPEWAECTKGKIENSVDLMKIAQSLNATYDWNDDKFMPIVYVKDSQILGVQLYETKMWEYDHKTKNEKGKEIESNSYTREFKTYLPYMIKYDCHHFGAMQCFPIFPESIKQTMKLDEYYKDADAVEAKRKQQMKKKDTFDDEYAENFFKTMSSYIYNGIFTDGLIGNENLSDVLDMMAANSDAYYRKYLKLGTHEDYEPFMPEPSWMYQDINFIKTDYDEYLHEHEQQQKFPDLKRGFLAERNEANSWEPKREVKKYFWEDNTIHEENKPEGYWADPLKAGTYVQEFKGGRWQPRRDADTTCSRIAGNCDLGNAKKCFDTGRIRQLD